MSRRVRQAWRLGGLEGAERERARQVFLQLVRPGEGTEDTRRIASRTEIKDENWEALARLASSRLVTTGRDEATGEETAEVVHEEARDRLIRGLPVDRG